MLLNSVIADLAKDLANTEDEGKQLEINFQAEIQQLKVGKAHLLMLMNNTDTLDGQK